MFRQMAVSIEIFAMGAVECDPVLINRLVVRWSFASHAYVLQPRCPYVSSIPVSHVLVLVSTCSCCVATNPSSLSEYHQRLDCMVFKQMSASCAPRRPRLDDNYPARLPFRRTSSKPDDEVRVKYVQSIIAQDVARGRWVDLRLNRSSGRP
jgi:hypothetical protein